MIDIVGIHIKGGSDSMNDEKSAAVTRRQYWQEQITAWQMSKLSQTAYCAQSGIKLSTFSYWVSELKPKDKTGQFAKIKIVKDKIEIKPATQSIQIKLLTGHVVYLPIEIGISEITKLIHKIGLPHA